MIILIIALIYIGGTIFVIKYDLKINMKYLKSFIVILGFSSMSSLSYAQEIKDLGEEQDSLRKSRQTPTPVIKENNPDQSNQEKTITNPENIKDAEADSPKDENQNTLEIRQRKMRKKRQGDPQE